LMYVMKYIRPYIASSVSKLSRYKIIQV
jgi:hypothetical protein